MMVDGNGGETDDAEFLKWHLIVSLALGDKQEVYRDNGGATVDEYKNYTGDMIGNAFVLSAQGDPNYRFEESGMDAATALAAYGQQHGLNGRY